MQNWDANDYAIIGNHASCALINPIGSIEWLCLPFLDSPSLFGEVLHPSKGGRFQITPLGSFRSKSHYLSRSLVLETVFETPTGRATLVDWMPIGSTLFSPQSVFRRIQMIDGKISWTLYCNPRYQQGSAGARAEPYPHGLLFRNPEHSESSFLYSSRIKLGVDASLGVARADFTLEAGQEVQFTWAWGRRSGSIPLQPSVDLALSETPLATLNYWRNLAHTCPASECLLKGPWHDIASQSITFFKLLIAQYSGAIPDSILNFKITSPRAAKVERQLQPHICSIRYSALKIQVLYNLGLIQEAKTYFQWLVRILERDRVENLESHYTLDGDRIRSKGTQTSRFGLDLYGQIIIAAAEYYRMFHEIPPSLGPILCNLADEICQSWRKPDYGVWKHTTRAEHYVVSKLFCWAGLDRMITLAGNLSLPCSPRWKSEKLILARVICEQGFDSKQNSFIKAFGRKEIDASCLWALFLGFLPLQDPRILGTLKTIETCRFQDNSDEKSDLGSSFFVISALALLGKSEQATAALETLCRSASSWGLFTQSQESEEGEVWIDFPSTEIHFLLLNAVFFLRWASDRSRFRHLCLFGTPGIPFSTQVNTKTA